MGVFIMQFLISSAIFYIGGVFALSLFKGCDTKWRTILGEALAFVIGVWASLHFVCIIFAVFAMVAKAIVLGG